MRSIRQLPRSQFEGERLPESILRILTAEVQSQPMPMNTGISPD